MTDTLFTGLREAVKSLGSGSLTGPSTRPSAKELKRVRTKLGLSQEAFARRLGVSVGTVQSWEIGRRKPGRLASIVIAKALEDVP
jgi:putative transcriptional regulator